MSMVQASSKLTSLLKGHFTFSFIGFKIASDDLWIVFHHFEPISFDDPYTKLLFILFVKNDFKSEEGYFGYFQ